MISGIISDRCALFGCVLLTLALASSQARAQNIPLGSHVRVFPLAPAQPSEGSLAALSPDSLSVRVGMSSTLLTFPMDSVRSIDVGEGVRARHGVVLRDTGIGLALGVGAAILLTKAGCATNHSSGDGGVPCEIGYVVAGVPLGILGAVIGAHIAKNHKTEQWDRVFERASEMSLLVGPAPHRGFAVGLSIPFGDGASQR